MVIQPKDKERIALAIVEAEKMTSGEIRVHVARTCPKNILEYAKKVFLRIGMHRTKERNAVLIFVAPRHKIFAILGDSGIHQRVGDSFWQETRDQMLSYFSKDKVLEGIVAGVLSVGEKLKKYFPIEGDDKNELSNEATES